ncbi:hypothetical protein PIB30_090081 [Stylosanthes scabra]|uniref:Uncharacterized protein n=1 Tax=Stylosanthes scabra TaxID=79078 RepID=A0ABU6ZSS2_9FABA|nr:hypothetical protein [Stylosanthes scabra]
MESHHSPVTGNAEWVASKPTVLSSLLSTSLSASFRSYLAYVWFSVLPGSLSHHHVPPSKALCHHWPPLKNSSIQLKLEKERKTLKGQVYHHERKVEVFRQELVAAESTLSVKDSELTALKNNLRELEEFREIKEVLN